MTDYTPKTIDDHRADCLAKVERGFNSCLKDYRDLGGGPFPDDIHPCRLGGLRMETIGCYMKFPPADPKDNTK